MFSSLEGPDANTIVNPSVSEGKEFPQVNTKQPHSQRAPLPKCSILFFAILLSKKKKIKKMQK